MTPQTYCHRVCKKSGSNFVYTFYLFGKKRRQALEAFYAFCRTVDDAVDRAVSREKAAEAIQYWKEEIDLLYQKTPRDLISKALVNAVQKYKIPKIYLNEIVAGCEIDLYKKTYDGFEELENYCYKVASCVGMVCLHIFGAALNEELEEGGKALGKALQLTNIIRDIATDLKRERVYLPQEDLKRFQVSVEDLKRPSKENLNLLDLLYFEIDRAQSFFNKAWALFPTERRARRRLIAALLMGRFYQAILFKLKQYPLKLFETKIRLTNGEKLKIALSEIFFCL